MELVRGTTLRDQLDGRIVLDPREVVHVGAEVADALAAAHRAGLVHRDIKPANILLCADDRVMVTDFGIAKIRDDPDSTQAGTMLGTVKYLAPEQVRGEPVDGRTDVYALGVVLFECLCARPPFTGDNPAATALARLQQPPPRPSHLRPTIPRGTRPRGPQCLQLDPADRYQSADELRAALLEPATLRVDDDLTVAGAASSWPLPTSRPTGRRSSTRSRAARRARPGPGRRAVGTGGRAGRGGRCTAPGCGRCWPSSWCVTALIVAFLLLDHTGFGHRLFGRTRTTARRPPRPRPATNTNGDAIHAVDELRPVRIGHTGRERLPSSRSPSTATAEHRVDDRVLHRPPLRQPQARRRPVAHPGPGRPADLARA